MKTNRLTVIALASVIVTGASAQDERSSSSLYLNPAVKASYTVVPFSVEGEGHRFQPTWGLDQAWISEQNLRKGINHIGRSNIGIGRTAFRTTKALTNDSVLASDQTSVMRRRANIFDIVSPTLPLVFTADQEAGSDQYFVIDKSANVDRWAACINSHVHWMQANTQHPIAGISPFNEPDYWTTEEGATVAKHRDVARLLKEQYPRCADIAIVGGNTLNNDKAWEWYNGGKQYYDWGNTHQLAGSFDNFASFFSRVSGEGKIAYADEMHNVGEAMIGLEYGMTVGIWWGFDSRARGEFCDISRNGQRLAYAEHRNNWTAASVYRHDDGRVKAFVGSSERQAVTTDFQFVSTDRDLYFDGYGPVRAYAIQMPGGTAYQKGQTNAERVIDITWGEDVAPCYIAEGTYKIVNKATGNVVTASGNNIVQQKFAANNNKQQWNVKPCDPRIGGDYSFYDFESVSNKQLRMNVENFSTLNDANVMAYSQNATPSSNEQWYLQYAGKGYYYIRSRETALYLTSKSSLSVNNVNVVTNELFDDEKIDRQLWRLLPLDVNYETDAPAAPTNLSATPQTAAVRLTWDANGEADLEGYMVLRAPQGTTQWNTIARKLKTNYFVDNSCRQGVSYEYKVKAIDLALNMSEPSQPAVAMPTGERGMIARWRFDSNLYDDTPNMMDVALQGSAVFSDDCQVGSGSLRLMGTNYLQLPYETASSDELTVALWVKWASTTSWQRIFDFGYDTDHYMFLTPSNGSIMRFAIKNGDSEQTVDCPTRLAPAQWKHVVVSIGRDKTTIYVDGQEAASSTGITIKPSDIRPVLNYIGRSQFAADPLFAGYIDDVRIYNYAVTAAEAAAIMTDTADAIHSPQQSGQQASGRVYNLRGQRVPQSKTGLNIIDGRKIIVQ